MKGIGVLAVVLGLAGLLASCAQAPPTPQAPQGETRGPVHVDQTDLLLMESYPVQVALVVRGSLPSPCHQARWEVSGPDKQGRIDVALYSVAPEGLACAAVLEPVELSIRLGSYELGSFGVWLNGDMVQAFELP